MTAPMIEPMIPDGWRNPSSASLWKSRYPSSPPTSEPTMPSNNRYHRELLTARHEQPSHEAGDGAGDEDGEDQSTHESAFPSGATRRVPVP